MCVWHLNLNLSVYESQTASPSSAFAAQYQFSVAYKSPSILAVLGTHCLALPCRPPTKCCPTPMLSVRTSLGESVWASLCVLNLCICTRLCVSQHSFAFFILCDVDSSLLPWLLLSGLLSSPFDFYLERFLLEFCSYMLAGFFLKPSSLMCCVLGTRLLLLCHGLFGTGSPLVHFSETFKSAQ